MDVDGVDDISERSFPDVAPDYCERYVGIVVTVSVDSDSDHGGDLASLSSFSDSDCDSVAVTSETQDVPEENDEFLEENEAEVASNHSLFGSDRGGVALNAELADLLVVLDDELANIRAEYEELEENQDELANPVENEEQIEELASTLEEEQIVENLVEVASNPSVANVSSLMGDSDIESMVDGDDFANNFEENEEELEENQVELASNSSVANVSSLLGDLEGSENGHASITDLLASSFKYSSEDEGWIDASDDDDAEDIVEDVDEVILVDDDEIMVDLEASELSGNREQFLQSVPVATAASDSAPSLTPSEEVSFRIFIERTRLYEMEREAADLQARVDEQEIAAELLYEEVAAEQHTGYGNFEGNLDIEGVLPKLPLFSLISNWLSNAENNFNLFI